ncbi:MAG: PaaI family thioesterase [Alphaproteobacteria bacterium]|nr:MAG: PaaI family thioesterase [Alphaproteobacteria bacterium]
MTDSATLARVFASFQTSPAIASLALFDVAMEPDGAVRASMPLGAQQERFPGSNQFHGGPVAALIDTIGDLAVAVAVDGPVPTVNLRIDYLKPALAPHLTASARVRRLGKSLAVTDIEVTDATGALVALGRGTYSTRVG